MRECTPPGRHRGSLLPGFLLVGLIIAAGCASPARTCRLKRDGDRLLLDGDRALDTDRPREAAELYGDAYGKYRACATMADKLLEKEGDALPPEAILAAREARAAAPRAALAAAAAHGDVGLIFWRQGDRSFDAGDLDGAIEAYAEAERSLAAEARYLRLADRHLRSEAAGNGDRAAVSDRLSTLREERRDLRDNQRLASARRDAEAFPWGEMLGEACLASIYVLGEVARVSAVIAVEILSHPEFWKCCFEIAEAICEAR